MTNVAVRPRYPSLIEINTRAWLYGLSREPGKPITFAEIDDAVLDDLARRGFDWVWLLSVWQTGAASRAVSRSNLVWRAEFAAVLPDLTEEDICGSGFAISAYEVDGALGGKAALAAFRARLAVPGLRLMLDFVPNHTARQFVLGLERCRGSIRWHMRRKPSAALPAREPMYGAPAEPAAMRWSGQS